MGFEIVEWDVPVPAPQIQALMPEVSPQTGSNQTNDYAAAFQFLVYNWLLIIEDLGLRNTSLKTYKEGSGFFLSFIERDGGLRRETLVRYKSYLNTLDIQDGTRYVRFCISKALLKGLYNRHFFSTDITKGVKGYQIIRGHKKDGLNGHEVQSLIDVIETEPNEKQKARIRAMAYALIFLCIRQTTLVKIKKTDVDTAQGIIWLTDKGKDGKRRMVMPEVVREAFLNYEHQFAEYSQMVKTPYYFFSRSNKNAKLRNGQLETASVAKMIKKSYFGVAQISEEKTMHGIRHFTITELYKKLGSAVAVASYTGQRPETVEIYIDTRLRAEMQEAAGEFLETLFKKPKNNGHQA